ncbi:MAG: helix-turn-helix domain-containing protein [Oscillospiraceae bacterium]|nr:helix-turn-helix domain-containing protein [Oscillospiraceae bacterium]
MTKKKYTHIKEMEPEIIKMREMGMSRTQIAEELGLEWKQIDNWVTRYNKRKAAVTSGLPAKRKGRPRTRPLTTAEEYEREIARLEMENKLLRDFLQLTERK